MRRLMTHAVHGAQTYEQLNEFWLLWQRNATTLYLRRHQSHYQNTTLFGVTPHTLDAAMILYNVVQESSGY